MHTNYQPRKEGLYEAQIRKARSARVNYLTQQGADLPAAYANRKDFTKVPVGVMQIQPEIATALKEHREWGNNRLASIYQHQRLRYSDRGDFTRCYRGGF